MLHLSQFWGFELICYFVATLVAIKFGNLIVDEWEAYEPAYATATPSPAPTQAPIEHPVVQPVSAFKLLDDLTTTFDAVVTQSAITVETPLYQEAKPPALSMPPLIEEDTSEEALEPVELISCQRFVDNAIAACETTADTGCEQNIPSGDKPVISIKGLKLYKLHKKSVLRIEDLPVEVPEIIRRYTLHKKKVVRLEALEEFFTVNT